MTGTFHDYDPLYWSPIESNLIDDDVKEIFSNRSALASDIVNMQLIKTMKQLIEELKKGKEPA